MATDLAIDDNLLEEALRIGGHRTKKATVTEALEKYIQRRKQTRVLELYTTTRRRDGVLERIGRHLGLVISPTA